MGICIIETVIVREILVSENVEVHVNALIRALASRSLHIYVVHCSVDSINKFASQQIYSPLSPLTSFTILLWHLILLVWTPR